MPVGSFKRNFGTRNAYLGVLNRARESIEVEAYGGTFDVEGRPLIASVVGVCDMFAISGRRGWMIGDVLVSSSEKR
jgi:hypothetical protein